MKTSVMLPVLAVSSAIVVSEAVRLVTRSSAATVLESDTGILRLSTNLDSS